MVGSGWWFWYPRVVQQEVMERERFAVARLVL